MLFQQELISLDDTTLIARKIADSLQSGLVVALSGNLGAGKTTLTRSILQTLGVSGSIKSPTFTLVEPYEIKDFTIYHFDLYRFSDPDEWFDAGFDEYFIDGAVCFIEWAEKAKGLIPYIDWHININLDNDIRIITIESLTNVGEKCLKKLMINVGS